MFKRHHRDRRTEPMPTESADDPTIAIRPEDTGSRMQRRTVDLPQPPLPPRTIIVTCAGCQGHGRVRMSVHDILTESIGLIADQADAVVIKFYDRLFAINPVLVKIFPPDLLKAPAHAEGSPGAHQRDQLVEALVKVATLYGAGEREEKELDAFLRQAGRSHSLLPYPDGPRPPTREEYGQVKRALFETLVEVAGDRWKPEYTAAWSQAYDDAETEMRHATKHEGREMQVPRQTRRSADH
jgi:hemoglobin-like flavoprotein